MAVQRVTVCRAERVVTVYAKIVYMQNLIYAEIQLVLLQFATHQRGWQAGTQC